MKNEKVLFLKIEECKPTNGDVNKIQKTTHYKTCYKYWKV
jgi:hypothetical protein